MGNIVAYKPYSYNASMPEDLGTTSLVNKTPFGLKNRAARAKFTPNYDYLVHNGSIAASGLNFQTAQFDNYDENYEMVVALNLGTKDGVKRINISTN